MISIIICSKGKYLPDELIKNIDNTIGCEHEIVAIDNSSGKHSIFSAYNEGIHRAKGDILHFRHDDITHISTGWGRIASEILKDNTIGLLGVGGSHIMPKFPVYYCESPYMSFHNQDNDNGKIIKNSDGYWSSEGLADVAVVDGQQFFIPKRLFPPLKFDEVNYSGFHGYDMDICMQVQSLGLRVVVSNQILGEHRWSNSKWQDKEMMAHLYSSMDVFYRKWESLLPIVRGISKPEAEMVNMMELWQNAYSYRRILKSKAYRLGKLILSPLKRNN